MATKNQLLPLVPPSASPVDTESVGIGGAAPRTRTLPPPRPEGGGSPSDVTLAMFEALAAGLASSQGSQAAIDALQSAAIAATQAVDAAQQLALVTAESVNASQAEAIAAVRDRLPGTPPVAKGIKVYPAARGIRIEDFTPAGSLTASNFTDALHAAYAAVPQFANVGARQTTSIIVPAGTWDLESPLDVPGTSGQSTPSLATPGLLGAGSGRTVLRVVNAPGAGVGALQWGVTGEDDVVGLTLEGFTLRTVSAMAGDGVVIEYGSRVSVRDVEVSGFNAVQKYDSGCALRVRFSSGVVLADIKTLSNQLGVRLQNTSQLTATALRTAGNAWLSAALDLVSGSWRGGAISGGAAYLATAQRGSRWYAGALFPCASTGWSVEVRAGTGAQLAAATYREASRDAFGAGAVFTGSCVVAGLQSCSPADVGRWLECERTDAPAWTATDIVSGLYRVLEYISDTELRVAKGTSHGAISGIKWRLLGSGGGNFLDVSGWLANGSSRSSTWFLGPDENGSESCVRLAGVPGSGVEVNVDAIGINQLDVVGCYPIRDAAVRARRIYRLETDQELGPGLDLDDYTRAASHTRGPRTSDEGYGGTVVSMRTGTPHATRVDALARELRASFFLDASRVEYMTAGPGATDVSKYRDAVSALDATLQHVGSYVQRSADERGVPVLQLGGQAALQVTLPATAWPKGSAHRAGSVFVVARCASTGSGVNSFGAVQLDAQGLVLRRIALRLNDANHDGMYGHHTGPALDALMPAEVLPGEPASAVRAGVYTRTPRNALERTYHQAGQFSDQPTPETLGNAFFDTSLPVTLHMGTEPSNTCATQLLYTFAFFPWSLTQPEAAALLDAAARQYGITRRYL